MIHLLSLDPSLRVGSQALTAWRDHPAIPFEQPFHIHNNVGS